MNVIWYSHAQKSVTHWTTCKHEIFISVEYLICCNQGCGAGAGAGAAETVCSQPEPESEPSKTGPVSGSEKGYNCGKKKQNESEITRNSRTNSLPKFYINNFTTSAINYLKFSWLTESCIWHDLNTKQVLYQVRSCHWPDTSSRADSPSGI